jgi:hypothetical protein
LAAKLVTPKRFLGLDPQREETLNGLVPVG